MERKAKLIIFDGVDGCGKTSIISELKGRLIAAGKSVLVVKENTSHYFSRKLWELCEAENIDSKSMSFLFAILLMRSYVMERVTIPALSEYDYVIYDRFVPSTLVYQRDLIPYEDLVKVNEYASLGIKPDLVFIVDVSPETAIKRLKSRGNGNYLDEKLMSQIANLRRAYLNLVTENKDFYLINGEVEVCLICDSILWLIERGYGNV